MTSLLLLTIALSAEPKRVPDSILDLALEPPVVITAPGPEYSSARLDYAMVIGADRTPGGRIWAAWVAGGDSDKGLFVCATSDDDGETWSEPRLVIDPPDVPDGLRRRLLVGNFWTDPTGKLWLFFDQSMGYFDGRAGAWAITCSNPDADEPTWSAPRRIWHGATLNKPIVLKNGEWLMPISLWTRDRIRPAPLGPEFPELDEFRMANLFVSTDQGATWTRRGGVVVPQTDFDEHMFVELKDGRLWMLARTKYGLAETFSSDGGATWTEPQPSAIQNPSARFFLRRLASGRLLLVKNGPLDERLKKRSHLTAYLSDDEGKTWRGGLVIDERDGVSYPDGFQAPDGTIHIIHDRERAKEREILMARFTEEDVLAGKFVTPGSRGKLLVHKARGGAKPQATERWAKETLAKVTPIERPANEPVLLKKSTPAAEIDGRSYDLVVFGGTAGGAAAAVRAAREGCTVLLVQHNGHLGGMLTNGLGQWDAVYGGSRAALFTELLTNIEGYYAAKYGLDSPDFKTAHYTHDHYPVGWCEPHVFEREINRLVAGETNITLLYDHHPTALERDGTMIKSATFVEHHGSRTIRVQGKVFIDGSYEGDLLPLAKVAYRVGREARDEYGESHAGKCFTNIAKGPAPTDAAEGRLNIRAYGSKQGSIDPTSPFSADGAVQAYNMRFCVTRDPANRIMLTEPPPGYDRNEYLHYERRYIGGGGGPNKKSHMNSPILPGENHAYPEADWPTRDRITARHTHFGLGLIWFLQNDESISEAKRDEFRQWGLPKDEFADNGHIPYEMYVREARRLVGRHVFKEQDNSLAPGLGRTPIMADSVAVTEWYMDSHACTTESRPGYKYDGKLILTEESRPAQIPYRSLLSNEVDNLIVPVCLSATHIAWGAVRLEPVWMQTGEAAGFAAALSVQNNVTPVKLDPDVLLQTLVERKQYVSFFNDSGAADDHPATAAAQFFGTKGFFADYDARLDEPVTQAVAQVWVDGAAQIRFQDADPTALARLVAKAEASESEPMTVRQFAGQWKDLGALLKPAPVLTRGRLLQALWDFVKKQ